MAEKLQIVIDAKDQASGVIRGVAGTTKAEFKGMSGVVKAHAGEIRAAGMAMTAFGAVVVGVAAGCVGALRTQEIAQAKLTAAIKGTAQQIDRSRLEKLAADLQKVTTFGDEATIEMMAILTTFSLTQDQIEQLAPRIQNISAMMGTDLVSSAVAVGKAIQMGSASALQRYGIIIDEATMKSGDFNGILKAIDANTGNAAEELAKGAGAAEQLKNTLGDTAESIGKALVPALGAANKVLAPMAEVVGKIAETPLGRFFIVAGTAVGALLVPLGMITMALPSVFAGLEIMRNRLARVGGQAAVTKLALDGVAVSATRMGAAGAAGGAAVGAGGAAAAAGGAGLRGLGVGVAAGAGARGLLRAGAARGALAVASKLLLPLLAIEAGLMLKSHLEAKTASTLEASALAAGQPAALYEEMMARHGAGLGGFGGGMDVAGAMPEIFTPAAIPQMPEVAAALAAAPRHVAGMAEVGAGTWMLPGGEGASRAGRGLQPLPVHVETEGVIVSEERIEGARKLLIEVLIPTGSPGVLDDATSEWMADLQYQAGAWG